MLPGEEDFGIVPLPGLKTGQLSSFAGGDVIGIPTGSKHVKEATDFITWYLSEDVQLENVAKINGVNVPIIQNQSQYFQTNFLTLDLFQGDNSFHPSEWTIQATPFFTR